MLSLLPHHAFGALLVEKLAELEADERRESEWVEESAVDQLRHAALQTVLAAEGGLLPRSGHAAYHTVADVPPEPDMRHLNILF